MCGSEWSGPTFWGEFVLSSKDVFLSKSSIEKYLKTIHFKPHTNSARGWAD